MVFKIIRKHIYTSIIMLHSLTSWDVSSSRYIMIDLKEFPCAAIITFFPCWS
ncbi:hypothetical protein HanPSC8_Chr04g0152981 [Helianthus annuus]|nr:hypothetical protein HanPSC8_Chr04g0152981 [Helianthus annuus]